MLFPYLAKLIAARREAVANIVEGWKCAIVRARAIGTDTSRHRVAAAALVAHQARLTVIVRITWLSNRVKHWESGGRMWKKKL